MDETQEGCCCFDGWGSRRGAGWWRSLPRWLEEENETDEGRAVEKRTKADSVSIALPILSTARILWSTSTRQKAKTSLARMGNRGSDRNSPVVFDTSSFSLPSYLAHLSTRSRITMALEYLKLRDLEGLAGDEGTGRIEGEKERKMAELIVLWADV